jgi:hypothetical protein
MTFEEFLKPSNVIQFMLAVFNESNRRAAAAFNKLGLKSPLATALESMSTLNEPTQD